MKPFGKSWQEQLAARIIMVTGRDAYVRSQFDPSERAWKLAVVYSKGGNERIATVALAEAAQHQAAQHQLEAVVEDNLLHHVCEDLGITMPTTHPHSRDYAAGALASVLHSAGIV